jgi:hypothetical protein
MDQPGDQTAPASYRVRFDGGPRDGAGAVVLGLDSGQPPDLLLTPDRPSWVYLLAGGAGADGSLPYRWMPPSRADALRRLGRRRP